MLLIYLALALVSPVFVAAFPRTLGEDPESPTCLSPEANPDHVSNVTTDRYYYQLYVLPAMDFYWAEARDILAHVYGIVLSHDPEEDIPVGGYKYNVPAWPGEKGKEFKMDRYTPLSDFKWKDAVTIVEEMRDFNYDVPSPHPIRTSGLSVILRDDILDVAWSRLTYDDDPFPRRRCSGEGENTQAETS